MVLDDYAGERVDACLTDISLCPLDILDKRRSDIDTRG